MKNILLVALWLLACSSASAQDRQWYSEADIAGLDFPGDARYNAVSFVIDDIAYVGTGENSDTTTTSFWKYAPTTKTWTRIADFIGNKRSGAVAFSLNGKGYVGTGKSGATLFNDFYRYDPVIDTWEQVASFGGGERRNAVAFTANGKAYVGTGQTTSSFGSVSSDLWEYDPTVDAWTKKTNLPNTRDARTHAVAFSINNQGYIATGFGKTNYVSNLYRYDPANDEYTFILNFINGRQDGVTFVLDDKAYIGLGDTRKDFLVYDPSTDQNY